MKRLVTLLATASMASCHLVTGELPCEQDANCPEDKRCFATVDHEVGEVIVEDTVLYRDGVPTTVCLGEEDPHAAPVSLFPLICLEGSDDQCQATSVQDSAQRSCVFAQNSSAPTVLAKAGATKFYTLSLQGAPTQGIPCASENGRSEELVGWLVPIKSDAAGTLMIETSRSTDTTSVRLAVPLSVCSETNEEDIECHVNNGASGNGPGAADADPIRLGARVDLDVDADETTYVFLLTPNLPGFDSEPVDLAVRLE